MNMEINLWLSNQPTWIEVTLAMSDYKFAPVEDKKSRFEI